MYPYFKTAVINSISFQTTHLWKFVEGRTSRT